MMRPTMAARASDASGAAVAGRGKRYGSKFQFNFAEFREEDELTDVVVVVDGVQWSLHMLLLAYHSEFFRRAFSSEFREAAERKVILGFSDPNGVWPTLVDYFYVGSIDLTDDNVMPLLAISRELLIPRIQEYCSDFAQGSLECSNALAYLSQAVQLSFDGFRHSCVQLVAENFSTSFSKATDGLPVEAITEILEHPALYVQCEEQVLVFVLRYISHHDLPAEAVSRLYSHVRFMYLSNAALAQLSDDPHVPRDVLLHGMAARLSALDRPENAAGLAQPRSTYCSALEYGLPGGSEYVAVPIEAIWDELVPLLRVQVSGEPEGDPESILRTADDSTWFAVCDDGRQPVWIEVLFPEYMRVVEFSKYTFSHGMNLANHMFPYGISDSDFFAMKGLVTQVCQEGAASDAFVTLKGHESCQEQTEFSVQLEATPSSSSSSSSSKALQWRRMRILPAGHAAAGECVNRLSIRKLRLFGKVEISLLKDGMGQGILATWRHKCSRPPKTLSL